MSLLKRFPSYNTILEGAVVTFKRYPFAVLCAIIATIITVSLADRESLEPEYLLRPLQFALALGLPLFVALTHLTEKRQWKKTTSLFAQISGAVILAVYYLSLPDNVFAAYSHPVRFLLIFLGLHFLAAVLPYSGDKQDSGFWRYNILLFLRFLKAALFSAVLYIGLIIAIAAADHLFDLGIPERRYFQIWLVIVGIFNTFIFLGGIPRDLKSLDGDRVYPKALVIFTKYILVPLVMVYFVILILYEAKIAIEWNWPKGWVAHLVLWYSVLGILSVLLLNPLRESAEHRWIGVVSRWFFRTSIPLIVLLFLAIFRRIGDYGLTENRYLVLAMALGLSVAAIYLILSRKKDIRIIPGILSIIAFVSAIGPWSAFALSENSQRNRLEALMKRNNILDHGVVKHASRDISFRDRREMSNIVAYLNEWHGLRSFASWFSDDVMTSLDTIAIGERKAAITGYLGFEPVEASIGVAESGRFSWRLKPGSPVDIAGYDFLLGITMIASKVKPDTFTVNGISGNLRFDAVKSVLKVSLGDISDDTINFSLKDILSGLVSSEDYDPIKSLRLSRSGERFSAALILKSISGFAAEDSLNIQSFTADLLFRLD